MSRNPLISVVIPCYNYDKYVEEAIRSVLNQTYKNIELIVINDGSTDNSNSVIRKLKEKYTFHYHSQSNKGIISTRNKGVDLAKGEYIIQLDADDALPNNYVSTLVSAAFQEKEQSDIYYTPALDYKTGKKIIDPPEYSLEILKHHNYIHASSMVRAKTIKKYTYDQYLNDKGLEDWDMFLGMCLDGATGLCIKEVSLKYRQHLDIKSRNEKIRNNDEELDAIRHILTKYITKHPQQIGYMISYLHFIDRLRITTRDNRNHLAEIHNLKQENINQQQTIEYLQAKINKLRNLLPVRIYLAIKSLFTKNK